MDADALQMMADLGLARRDFVSAPAADSRGRLMGEDSHRQQAVLTDFEARREQTRAAGSADDHRAATLRAWNTDTTFERDSVTDQLENRFSGQGHRAMLIANPRGDRRWDATEARYGEERALYLQERAAAGGNDYVATATPATGGDRFRGHGSNGANRATPRTFSGANGGNRPPERGRVVSAPNPNRAPSPRASGTVRFAPNGRRVEHPAPGSRNAAPPPTATAPARTPAPGRTAQRPANGPMAAAAPSQCRPTSALSSSSARAIPTNTTTSENVTHSEAEIMRFVKEAQWFAANPGPETDQHHRDHPDREKYTRDAFVKIVRRVFFLAQDPDGSEAADYVSEYSDRKWLFDEAMKAKAFVETGRATEMDAYYAAHPEHIDFCKAARKYFKPQPNVSNAQPEPTVAAPTVQPPIATAIVVRPQTPVTEPEPELEPVPAVIVQPSSIPAPTQGSNPPERPSAPSVETSATETSRPTVEGKLTTIFYNEGGDYLVHSKATVNIPAYVHISVTSQSPSWDPRILISEIEALATRMQRMHGGTGVRSAARSEGSRTGNVDGMRVSADGIWEEE